MTKNEDHKPRRSLEEVRQIVNEWNPKPTKPSSTEMAKTIFWVAIFLFGIFLLANWLFDGSNSGSSYDRTSPYEQDWGGKYSW